MKLLREARKALKWSAKTAAAAIGVHVQTWLGYEAGKFCPTWPVLRRIRRELGVSLDALADACDRAEGIEPRRAPVDVA